MLPRFIPEPVSGGLLFSVLIAAVYLLSGQEIYFDLDSRDFLLIYFFTTIGINSSLKDLFQGGKPLVILLAITAFGFLDAILAIHVCMVLGLILNKLIAGLGLQLPLFVTCLFGGILATNFRPKWLPRVTGTAWPARKPSVALIAEISLGSFLAMSLMSMQLWNLVELAGSIFTMLAMQFVVAVLVNIFVVFPAMGKNYDAAVICAGFGGISLGSTPTAMANMSAVAQRYGNSHLAFIVVPLVCAFFIDLVNAFMIPWLLSYSG